MLHESGVRYTHFWIINKRYFSSHTELHNVHYRTENVTQKKWPDEIM